MPPGARGHPLRAVWSPPIMNDVPDPDADAPPENWKALAAEFAQARIELIRLEARDAGKQAAQRAATAVFIVSCASLFWILTVAGLIGLVAAARPDWTWWYIALAAGGIHLLVGLIALLSLRRPADPVFPLTRSELAKDQAWLETLKRKP